MQLQETTASNFSTKLTACALDAEALDSLLSRLEREGDILWQAVLTRGCDPLGRRSFPEEEQTVNNREALLALLRDWGQPDKLKLTVEVVNRGALSFVLNNCYPAAGSLVVSGLYREWSEPLYQELLSFFEAQGSTWRSLFYTKLGFSVVHSLIPLAISFVVISLAAVTLIPYEYRSGEMLWWLTAGTLLVTLRLAYSLSDWFIRMMLRRFPFWQWRG